MMEWLPVVDGDTMLVLVLIACVAVFCLGLWLFSYLV